MVEGDMVSGAGWISDESSCYGDEDAPTQNDDRPKDSFMTSSCSPDKDVNTIRIAKKPEPRAKHEPAKPLSVSKDPNEAPSAAIDSQEAFLRERKAMEEERLARRNGGKRKLEPDPEPQAESKPPPKLQYLNSREGYPDSWQLGESAEQFLNRLSPLRTSAMMYDWIWVENPRKEAARARVDPDVESFTIGGEALLAESLENRQHILSDGQKGKKTVLLKTEANALQLRISDLAKQHNVLSGKWMFFPKKAYVMHVWRSVVEGVLDDRLGPIAKVATDDGNEEMLICVYTKDFTDIKDVTRVLQELKSLGLVGTETPIYYKPDAYTYLDLKSKTASKYGLGASLYNSRSMLAGDEPSPSSSLPRKKQTTLSFGKTA